MRVPTNILKAVTFLCILTSALFFIAGCYFLWKNGGHGTANHSFLFGTSLENSLLENKLFISIAGSSPMLIPFFFKRDRFNLVLVILSAVHFFFLKYVLFVMSD